MTKLSLEFLVLTAARSGEVRLAAWEEMDPEARTWVISAGRMKARREHRVPLSGRALAILEEAQSPGSRSGLVFPVASGEALSGMTHWQVVGEVGSWTAFLTAFVRASAIGLPSRPILPMR